jgi:gluconolactonase
MIRNLTKTSAGCRVHTPISAVILCLLIVAGCGSDRGRTTEPSASASVVTTAPTTAAPATTAASTTVPADPDDPLAGRGELELAAGGFGWAEGPQWKQDEGVLLFTDLIDPTIYRLGADGEPAPFRKPSKSANGLAFDPQGRLLVAERETRRITRTESDGTVTTIAESFEGRPLNDPNDLAVRSDGTIYFTDPLYADHPTELDFHGVFRIAPDGTLTAERRGAITEQPNGIALSPDETRLYVANWADDLVWVFDVGADGSLSEARTFANVGHQPDGMAVDDAGNLFVATADGIEVYAPDGTLWGTIEVPEYPANVAFGGADGRTLYITATRSVFRVQLANPGPY